MNHSIAAKVYVTATFHGEKIIQFREIGTGGGWFSQNDLRAHFGLSDATHVEEIKIVWPRGKVQILKQVAVKQILTITEPDFRLSIESTAPLTHRLTVTGMPKATAVLVERSSDLVQWSEVGSITTGDDGEGALEVSQTSDGAFFRARVQ